MGGFLAPMLWDMLVNDRSECKAASCTGYVGHKGGYGIGAGEAEPKLSKVARQDARTPGTRAWRRGWLQNG